MLKKLLLKSGLLSFLLFCLGASAEDARIEIGVHGGEVWIQMEDSGYVEFRFEDPSSGLCLSFEKPAPDCRVAQRKNSKMGDIIERSWAQYPCDIACSENICCRRECSIHYSIKQEKQKCLALPGTQVERLRDVRAALSDPVESYLEDIELFDLTVFTDLDSGWALERFMDDLSISAARKFLRWIANDKDVAGHFYNLDKNRDKQWVLLRNLISGLVLGDLSNWADAFKKILKLEIILWSWF